MNTAEKKIKILTKLLDKTDELYNLDPTKQEFKDWREETKLCLKNFYGEENEYFERFNRLPFRLLRFELTRRPRPEVSHDDIVVYKKGLDEARVILRAVIKEERLFPSEEKPKEKRPEALIRERGNVFQFYITQANQNYNINDITLHQYISQVVNPDVKQLLQQLNKEVNMPDAKWKTIGNILKKLADKGTNILIQAIVCLIKSQLGI